MPKPKPVNWQLIEEQELYDHTNELIEKYHGNIQGVYCILMWRHNLKMDPDGYIPIADISKSPDKVRELRPHDFIIGLNKDAWSVLEPHHQTAIIDAQLERIALCFDKEGNPKEDDLSRPVYRLKRSEIIDDHTLQKRHGTTLQEIQEYVHDKFTNINAEKGSYIDKTINNPQP